jgi:hypothetical protein
MVYHHPSSPEKTPLLPLLHTIGKYSSNIITILPLVSPTLEMGQEVVFVV